MPAALSQFTSSLLGLKSRIKTGSDSPSRPYTSSSPDTALTACSIKSKVKFKAAQTIITIMATLSQKHASVVPACGTVFGGCTAFVTALKKEAYKDSNKGDGDCAHPKLLTRQAFKAHEIQVTITHVYSLRNTRMPGWFMTWLNACSAAGFMPQTQCKGSSRMTYGTHDCQA